eukprot:gene5451-biopygen8413
MALERKRWGVEVSKSIIRPQVSIFSAESTPGGGTWGDQKVLGIGNMGGCQQARVTQMRMRRGGGHPMARRWHRCAMLLAIVREQDEGGRAIGAMGRHPESDNGGPKTPGGSP